MTGRTSVGFRLTVAVPHLAASRLQLSSQTGRAVADVKSRSLVHDGS